MALNGVNVALAAAGQEWVMLRTMARFGIRRKEMQNHFTGPAFLPWHRMGNLNAWAGPLTMHWIKKDKQLNKKILGRMLELGISPVVPAFNGFVPKRFVSKFINETYFHMRAWGHFSEKYSSSILLDPSSQLFKRVGIAYLKTYAEEFSIHADFFSVDTFNEMSPPRQSSHFLAAYTHAVFSTLDALSPGRAIWTLQGWMFRDSGFWTPARAKALLASVPRGRVLVLDLAATTSPQHARLDSFFGQPWVYCMLHNYGGAQGLYGKAATVNAAPLAAREESEAMVGLGLTPEGIHTSYAMYDLMLEMGWRKEEVANMTKWFSDFATRRYQGLDRGMASFQKSLVLVAESAFSCCDHAPRRKGDKEFRFHGARAPLTQLPDLEMQRNLWYNEETLLEAWDAMVEGVTKECESEEWRRRQKTPHGRSELQFDPPSQFRLIYYNSSSPEAQNNGFQVETDPACSLPAPLQYDLIDLSRQSLVNGLFRFHELSVQAYRRGNCRDLSAASSQFLALCSDIDLMLSSSPHFLLGKWLEAAKKRRKKGNDFQALLLEFNARNQITLWGPKANILDYSAKQWAGLIADYYIPRWRLFFDTLSGHCEAPSTSPPFDKGEFKARFLNEIGIPFGLSRKEYPVEANGSAVRVAQQMHFKWRDKMRGP